MVREGILASLLIIQVKLLYFSPFSIKLAVGTSYVMFLGMLGVFAFHLLTFKGQTVIGKLSANNINFRNK